MKKVELIEFVAEEANISKKDAKIITDAVLAGLKQGLINDGKVALVGFGNFSVKVRPAHTGRNPMTGEEIDVPEKSVVKFKPSTELKESVNS